MNQVDKYGVEYSEDGKTLITCPIDFKGEYVIPNGVTSIGEYAFQQRRSLTSITIPDSVQVIGNRAFCDDFNLSNVSLGKSIKTIGSGAFNCCPISPITLPDGLESIGACAFQYAKCTNIDLPESVTSVGWGAFALCSKLQKPIHNSRLFACCPRSIKGQYIIPQGIEIVADGAFDDCCFGGLTSIIFPKSILHIGSRLFGISEDYSQYLSKLESLLIPNGTRARLLPFLLPYADIVREY